MSKKAFTITKKIKKILEKLPGKPGVYRMKNEEGDVLYIGKAKSLKKRVPSYFKNFQKHPIRTQKLVSQISDIEITETSSELEALMLETNLIKEFRPKYNILMKDDKNFVYIKVTTQEDFPRILVVRKVENDKAKYFGPKTSALKVKATLKTLRNLFPFRTCNVGIRQEKELKDNILKKSRVKLSNKVIKTPCLYYHIKKCIGPCIGKVTKAEYAKIIDKVLRFLNGKYDEIEKSIKEEMMVLAKEKKFEKAAKLRDTMASLEVIKEKQLVTSADKENMDVINFVEHLGRYYLNVFMLREGKLINQENFIMTAENGKGKEVKFDEQELLGNFIVQFYEKVFDIPKRILIPVELTEYEIYKKWFKENYKKNVKLENPKRGKYSKLLELSKKNAKLYAKQCEIKWESEDRNAEKALHELVEYLKLKKVPKRIECFDVSHLGGTGKVASMVVFEKGVPNKNDYRRFVIKSLKEGVNDDYASMEEILRRRYEKIKGIENDIVLRSAKKADIEKILKINKENPGLFDIDAFNSKLDKKDFILAEYKNKIIGFVRVKRFKDESCQIGSLYVDPDFNGMKLGFKLMREIIFKFKYKKIYTYIAKHLNEYYEKFGYKQVKVIPEFMEKAVKSGKAECGAKGLLMMIERVKVKRTDSFEKVPDLVVVDGGKGQLSVLTKVLKERTLKIPAIGLAKQNEDVYVPGKIQPVPIPKDSEALYLLQRLRDEAHRFAITHQKIVRKKKMEKSVLDTIPGVGEMLKRKLLRTFGSVNGIKQAEVAEIVKVVKNKKLAERIKMMV